MNHLINNATNAADVADGMASSFTHLNVSHVTAEFRDPVPVFDPRLVNAALGLSDDHDLDDIDDDEYNFEDASNQSVGLAQCHAETRLVRAQAAAHAQAGRIAAVQQALQTAPDFDSKNVHCSIVDTIVGAMFSPHLPCTPLVVYPGEKPITSHHQLLYTYLKICTTFFEERMAIAAEGPRSLPRPQRPLAPHPPLLCCYAAILLCCYPAVLCCVLSLLSYHQLRRSRRPSA
jgi:hypothetical protein